MFYEIIDASVEHLGALPSQLELTHQQTIELLTYHRIQRRSQHVCPNCIEDDRKQTRVCFLCESEFTEDKGVSRVRKSDDRTDPVVRSIIAEQERNRWKNATPEEKTTSNKKFEKLYAGKIITPEQEAAAIASLKKSQEEAKTGSISLNQVAWE